MIIPVSPTPSPSDGDTDHFLASEPDLPAVSIAVIGMACRFSGGATNPEKLWELRADARSAWSLIPSSRFNQAARYHPDKEHLGTGSANMVNLFGGGIRREKRGERKVLRQSVDQSEELEC
ncbi:hypothetical protein N7471_001919 [Penicillium samsonianum]|uniref:uncharacterized protein n=1 Tax=Penicillium samsonianum TaxID=1882272 RepID=UPI002549A43D|nr:uncharacterized protein N7471_001919 [Penicillium samsonianum]KAJ6142466.1 hypothetical protein N7471_001919 [Penicillium samsonianum]